MRCVILSEDRKEVSAYIKNLKSSHSTRLKDARTNTNVFPSKFVDGEPPKKPPRDIRKRIAQEKLATESTMKYHYKSLFSVFIRKV